METTATARRRARKQAERAALEFPVLPPAVPEEPVQVAEGIFWARLAMPMALDHVNVYLLRDDDGWWLVDTGLNLEAGRAFWESLAERRLQGLPFKALLCTHFHYDHTGLASWLMERFAIPLYMSHGEFFSMRGLPGIGSEAMRSTMRAYLHRGGLDPETVEALLAAFGRDRFMPNHPTSFRRLRDGEALTIGGRDWRLIAGEGHSPEHLCLYCEEEALLIAGDQLLPEISPNILVSDVEPEADPLAGWFHSLESLGTLRRDTLVLPAHGLPFRGLQARVEQLKAHHRRHLGRLVELANGVPTFRLVDAMATLFPRKLPATERFLAFGETLAHLNWLTRRHHLQRARDAHGVDHYRSGTQPLPFSVR